MLSAIADDAAPLLHDRVVQYQSTFSVYSDAVSGQDAGSPNFFPNNDNVALDLACVDSVFTSLGCSDDPNALDQVRGTVARVTLGPFSGTNFGGVYWNEPANVALNSSSQGYDLRGATHLELDVRMPEGSSGQVRFGVGGRVTNFMPIPHQWTKISIPLRSLRDPGTNALSPPSLSNVKNLFSIGSNSGHANNTTGPVTVLVDNVHFTPVPTSRASALSLPRANETFGVKPVYHPVAGQPFPPDQVIRSLATTYEAALTVITLLASGDARDARDARSIADALVYAQGHDNNQLTLPVATLPDGSVGRGLHDAYSDGLLSFVNDQGSEQSASKRGQIRFAGFCGSQVCKDSEYFVVLDGAYGGNSSFALLALTAAYRRFGDVRYLEAARSIGRWLEGNLLDQSGTGYGGYFLGYPSEGKPKVLVRAKSVENNADHFAAFQSLSHIERSLGNTAAADHALELAYAAGDFVMAMFDAAQGRFNTGTLPDGPLGPDRGPGLEPDGPQRGNDIINVADFLDSNSFPMLSMAAHPRYRDQIDWRRPVDFALTKFKQTIQSQGESYVGFNIVEHSTMSSHRPYAGPNGIGWEFTAQMVQVMRSTDSLYGEARYQGQIDFYLGQIRKAQTMAPYKDGKGLVASTVEGIETLAPVDHCVSTPFQCIAARVGLAATTWAIMADKNINVFSLPPADPISPTIDRFHVTLSSNRKFITDILVGFTEGLRLAGANDRANYSLCKVVRSRCVPVSIKSVSFDMQDNVVHVTPTSSIKTSQRGNYRLTVLGSSTLVDWAGNRLDGDMNGTPSGNWTQSLATASWQARSAGR